MTLAPWRVTRCRVGLERHSFGEFRRGVGSAKNRIVAGNGRQFSVAGIRADIVEEHADFEPPPPQHAGPRFERIRKFVGVKGLHPTPDE